MRASKDIIADIQKIQNADRKYNTFVNEGGGEGYERESVPQSLDDELKAALAAEFAQKWTVEVTQKNRAAWNNAVKALGAAPTVRQVIDLEKSLGFSMSDLKKAIKINNL